MIFITVSPQQAAQYSYMCTRLKRMLNKMTTARKTLEGIADTSFDKSFAKCVYMITSESLQCENEIRAQIDSLNCSTYENDHSENKKSLPLISFSNLESVASYFEETYLNSYKRLLKDNQLAKSIKNLMQHHLQILMSSLTQLRLFEDVKTVAH